MILPILFMRSTIIQIFTVNDVNIKLFKKKKKKTPFSNRCSHVNLSSHDKAQCFGERGIRNLLFLSILLVLMPQII